MIDDMLRQEAKKVLERCLRADVRLATAESCTGGLIIGALTEIAGSSAVVDRGFVTYSNAAKTEMLGVPAMLINLEGAVSEKVARAMAEGALARAAADVTVAVTGIAGPEGGTPDKPVGLVHMACAGTGRPTMHRREVFAGDRATVRQTTVLAAFAMLLVLLGGGLRPR